MTGVKKVIDDILQTLDRSHNNVENNTFTGFFLNSYSTRSGVYINISDFRTILVLQFLSVTLCVTNLFKC